MFGFGKALRYKVGDFIEVSNFFTKSISVTPKFLQPASTSKVTGILALYCRQAIELNQFSYLIKMYNYRHQTGTHFSGSLVSVVTINVTA